MNKYDYAVTAAAALAYLLLRQQDAVGCVAFDEAIRQIDAAAHQHEPPDDDRPSARASPSRATRRICRPCSRRSPRTYPRRGMMVLISDLLVDAGRLAARPAAAAAARARRAGAPRAGRRRARFSVRRPDAVRRAWRPTEQLSCNPRALREGYLDALDEFPGHGPPRLCPRRRRLRADPHQRAARRRAGRVFEPPQPAATTLTDWRGISDVSFLFPTLLTIGLPLVAVPMLIHLINLRRQQRIRWAAMQFLLESQRQNKRWILLQAIAAAGDADGGDRAAGADAGPPGRAQRMAPAAGPGTTHHLVLVDDSYSMSDRWENTSALGEAKRAVQAIVDQAHRQSDSQLITLLRFSEAARLSAGAQPEVFCAADRRHLSQQARIAARRLGTVADRRRPGRRAQGDSPAAAGGRRSDGHSVSRERLPRPPICLGDRSPQAARRSEDKTSRRFTWCGASARRGRIWRSRRSRRNPACGRPASKCG